MDLPAVDGPHNLFYHNPKDFDFQFYVFSAPSVCIHLLLKQISLQP